MGHKAWLSFFFLVLVPVLVPVLFQGNPYAQAAPPATPANAPAPVKLNTDNEELKAAVANSVSRLGVLDVNKRKIFDAEVVPNYQRFIRNYQQGAQGLNVDIDLDTIRNYLRFYAPLVMKRPKGKDSAKEAAKEALKDPAKEFKALVYLKPDLSCEKCISSMQEIKRLAKERLEARGFSVVFLTAEDIKDPRAVEQALDEKVQEQFARQQASAALCIQWRLTPEEEIDSVHADEKHYHIHSLLLVRDFPRMEGKLDLLDTDRFDVSAQRLLTDQLAELGAQTVLAQAEQIDSGKEEITVTLSGVKDYSGLAEAKILLQSKMGTSGLIEERKISAERVVFAIKTPRTLPEVKKILAGVPNMEIQ